MSWMNTIAVDKLMDETRRLATLYRQTTGQTLPISAELARFDAAKYLHLQTLPIPAKGIDFVGTLGPIQDKNIQVKSRVIFNEKNTRYRLGQLNMDLPWDVIILVLYTEMYQPYAIHAATKEVLLENHTARGLISLPKFKAIGHLLWTEDSGIEWDEIWTNQSKSAYP